LLQNLQIHEFNKRLKNGEDEAMRTGWQRHYLRGINIATGDAADNPPPNAI
jgi:hypothetical protein